MAYFNRNFLWVAQITEASLQTNKHKEKVENGVEQPKKVIREAYARSHGWAPTVAQITVACCCSTSGVVLHVLKL
jgi:hypothetical protein